MDTTLRTKKAMTTDEVTLLLDLIKSRPIITSKETNASSNRVKEEAWISLTNEFNLKNGRIPRHKNQLKSKWDNLKKAARKRSQLNNLQTGGGKPETISPDEILDKVTSYMGSTCTRLELPFGGDDTGPVKVVEVVDDMDVCEEPTDLLITTLTPETKCSSPPPDEAEHIKLEEYKPRCLCGIKNRRKNLRIRRGKNNITNDGRRERNLAIAKYYEAKTVKLNLEIELLKDEMSKSTRPSSGSN